ncbi:MAG: dihydrolipoyl dehydrogenase [Verrucomicrobiales bacterium]|nr:dihydrolipoyl dehydrogenase [Verrucomicrobiales bacterium]|tara:strand:+ start:964 stop:2382 length:1419 start_codon:yes stop_codon:yes gene_type:complete
MSESTQIETELVVLGGGPGGYAAAFYAADLGKKVTLVERAPQLGGVCLHRGCIPSKALLHATHLKQEASEAENIGLKFSEPQIDLDKLRGWKDQTINKLADGIGKLAKARGVEVITGRGYFDDGSTLRVETENGQQFVKFQKAIIAVGSKAALPRAFDLGNPRVMTSRGALQLEDIPENLLVVGGGYIGMELGTVYAGLGSKVTLVESLDRILTGVDKDLMRPVLQSAKQRFDTIHLGAKVGSMATDGSQIKTLITPKDGEALELRFDRVLVAVGRAPFTQDLGLDNTKIKTNRHGFIEVDDKLFTAEPHIAAIGDCIGGAMLAHKAHHEARKTVDAIFQPTEPLLNMNVPAVIFTDPEVAWCGLTEEQAKADGVNHKVVKFPWGASGRAMSVGRTNGLTKLIVDPDTERMLGMGIAGNGAGELIGEGILALEMGATAFDLAHTIHPHPTLSETIMEAADVFYGHATHFKRG